MTARRAGVCMKMVRAAIPGTTKARVDVCGKPAGHEEVEHHGKFLGIEWRAGETPRHEPTILRYGSPYGTQTEESTADAG